jgi:hypothetical protein
VGLNSAFNRKKAELLPIQKKGSKERGKPQEMVRKNETIENIKQKKRLKVEKGRRRRKLKLSHRFQAEEEAPPPLEPGCLQVLCCYLL